MSVQPLERTDADLDTSIFEDAEFEIVCDIAQLQEDHGGRMPVCKGDPAVWVAWRANCCPTSPRYRLICDSCKKVYQAWTAHNASISCVTCGKETGGFLSYTPLKGES